jgi:hypothetical protein
VFILFSRIKVRFKVFDDLQRLFCLLLEEQKMDKNDNVQASSSTGESPVTSVQSPSASETSTTSAPTPALANPSFLQNVQQRIDSMGDDLGSLLAGRYDKRTLISSNNMYREKPRERSTTITGSFFSSVSIIEIR